MRDEMLMEIRVTCQEPVTVEGANRKIVMIPFTGEASGPYFTGSVIGTGVDTQKIEKDDSIMLSARYMLEGTDCAGNACRVFVENQGNWTIGFTPSVVTDSPLLAEWEEADLRATVEGIPGGVMVSVYRKA